MQAHVVCRMYIVVDSDTYKEPYSETSVSRLSVDAHDFHCYLTSIIVELFLFDNYYPI